MAIFVNTWVEWDKNGKLKHNNWGDELNFFFLQEIFKENFIENTRKDVINYSLIGSVVSDWYTNDNTIVWGAGGQVERNVYKKKPLKVYAVRGPITRKILLKNKIKCPKVYGDPALLLPYYYYPKVKKKYKIGLIPHCSSTYSDVVKRLCKDKRIHLIKMRDYENWTDIIDNVLSCDYIISESLHGLIIAEAYGIPNLWIDISINGAFDTKFHDFFQSIKCDREKALRIHHLCGVDDIIKKLSNYKRGVLPDLKLLVNNCPIKIKDKEFLYRVKHNKVNKTEVKRKKNVRKRS